MISILKAFSTMSFGRVSFTTIGKKSSSSPPTVPDGALVNLSNDFILDVYGNYILTTEI